MRSEPSACFKVFYDRIVKYGACFKMIIVNLSKVLSLVFVSTSRTRYPYRNHQMLFRSIGMSISYYNRHCESGNSTLRCLVVIKSDDWNSRPINSCQVRFLQWTTCAVYSQREVYRYERERALFIHVKKFSFLFRHIEAAYIYVRRYIRIAFNAFYQLKCNP